MRKKQNDVKRIVSSSTYVDEKDVPWLESNMEVAFDSSAFGNEVSMPVPNGDAVEANKECHLSLPNGDNTVEIDNSVSKTAPNMQQDLLKSIRCTNRKRKADESLRRETPSNKRANATVRTPGVLDLVKCTRCSEKFDPFSGDACVHPELLVMLCKRCYQQYQCSHSRISRDPTTDKDTQCRWCLNSNDGSLFSCSQCSHSFCRRCIKRNLGRSEVTSVESIHQSPEQQTPWLCYACNPQPLEELREDCQKTLSEVAAYRDEVQRRRAIRKPSQQSHIPSINASATTRATFQQPPPEHASSSLRPTLLSSGSKQPTPQQPVMESPSSSTPSGNNLTALYQEAALALIQEIQRQQTTSSHEVAAPSMPSKMSQVVINLNPSCPPAASSVPSTSAPSAHSKYWWHNPYLVNVTTFHQVLLTTLRMVGSFYQDLRLLHLAVQRETAGGGGNRSLNDHLHLFKSTLDTHYRDRLSRFPGSVHRSSSSCGSAHSGGGTSAAAALQFRCAASSSHAHLAGRHPMLSSASTAPTPSAISKPPCHNSHHLAKINSNKNKVPGKVVMQQQSETNGPKSKLM